MHSDATTTSSAENAIQAEAKAENARQVSALLAWADSRQQAEHIRALVSITMGHLSQHATLATREHSAQWQDWALGLADGTTVPVK